MSSYHTILGVRLNASAADIKKAYFKLAKKLHPDVNKSEDAVAEFIKVNEAYEILTNPAYKYKQNKKSASRTSRATPQNDPQYEEWIKKQREELRRKAQQKAKMSKSQFVKTSKNEAFKRDMKKIGNYLLLGTAILTIIFGIPIVLSSKGSSDFLYIIISTFLVILIINLVILSPAWISVILFHIFAKDE